MEFARGSGISDSNFIYVNFDVSLQISFINVRKQGDSIYYSKFIKVYKLPKVTTVNNFAFEKFTEKDGLCNNQVFCMAMDNQREISGLELHWEFLNLMV